MAYLTRTPTQIVGPFGACPFGACSDIYPPEVPAPPPPSSNGSFPVYVPGPSIPISMPVMEEPEMRRGMPWWAWLAIGIVLARAFGRS